VKVCDIKQNMRRSNKMIENLAHFLSSATSEELAVVIGKKIGIKLLF
jgi:intracellular sulfur oxidation DsrE/DsrF family protein